MIHTSKLQASAGKTGALLATGLIWALSIPFAAAQGGFNGPGRYEITNVGSGKVLDLDRNDQTSVIQFSSRGTDNQVWDIKPARSGFFYIQNVMNGNALESGGTRNRGVRATRFTGSSAQQWRIDTDRSGNVFIVSRLGNTLDIPNGSNADGVRLQTYASNGGPNQLFMLRQTSQNGDRGYSGSVSRNSNTVTCSSDNGQRVYCNADTRGGVRLLRQLSGSPCDQSTWGYDSRGIWVDRGCRAEFDISSGRGFTEGASGGVSGGNNYPQGRTRLDRIRAGTSIEVRTNEGIDVRNNDGRVFRGVVNQDVPDENGNIAIPRGSNVEMMVRNAGNQELALDLESVDVNGQRYAITTSSEVIEGRSRSGVGANKRTGEFVGGGALLGTILGAIAGGGRGAAIGAAAGAGAGAGTQILTRGRNVNVPSESLLTFRLDQPLQLGVPDNGYTRDGQHYHGSRY